MNNYLFQVASDAPYEKGIYMLEIRTDKMTQTIKLVVM